MNWPVDATAAPAAALSVVRQQTHNRQTALALSKPPVHMHHALMWLKPNPSTGVHTWSPASMLQRVACPKRRTMMHHVRRRRRLLSKPLPAGPVLATQCTNAPGSSAPPTCCYDRLGYSGTLPHGRSCMHAYRAVVTAAAGTTREQDLQHWWPLPTHPTAAYTSLGTHLKKHEQPLPYYHTP